MRTLNSLVGSSFAGRRRLEIFLGGRTTHLIFCLASILLSKPFCRLDIWENNDRTGLLFRLGSSNRWVEGPSYLFGTVTIFPESGFEELQLTMEAFLVAKNLGFVHQHLNSALYVGGGGRVM